MDLQRFVTDVFETLGGMVIPLEYGLCQVLIPENYKETFQGKSEYLLAFDYEVAQENQSAEFVTFGSFILDKVIGIVIENTVSTIRYGILPSGLTLSNPQRKIEQYLNANPKNIKITNSRTVMGLWTAFCFRIGYTSEERMEEICEIWIDMVTGNRAEKMEKLKSSVFFESSPSYSFPLACIPDYLATFKTAYNEVVAISEKRNMIYISKHEMDSELLRIDEYYEELIKENQKRMERRGNTEERIETLKAKEQALELDRKKQLSEMIDKYRVKTDITLDYSITYLIPRLEYKILIKNHSQGMDKILYYNFITKEFEET